MRPQTLLLSYVDRPEHHQAILGRLGRGRSGVAEDAAGGSLTAACVLLLRSHVRASERRDPVLLTVSLRVLP